MPRSGTLVICVQNLDYSGANQVVLNIVSGRTHESNVVVLSSKIGAFAARFIDSGAAVRIGNIFNLLSEIRDVFCVVCNTIMTADIVVDMAKRPQPVIWILHEWWDDEMIKINLSIRNIQGLQLDTVKEALAKASMIVFVCEAQRQLYKPIAPSIVIYVGVPAPLTPECRQKVGLPPSPPVNHKVFTFLTLGIVCPRKNQVWAVQLFTQFAGKRKDVKLLVVGVRHTRQYEIEYLEQVKKAIGKDDRIELHDVTSDVDQYYRAADCLLFTSVNEVTPMVISEAMSWGIPVLSTNIAGIPEMLTDGEEGFLFAPFDDIAALECMRIITEDPLLRENMGRRAIERFSARFDLDIMVEKYRQLLLAVAPPVILVDMDGVLVDWDSGFLTAWKGRSEVDRTKSYYMEHCVPPDFKRTAELSTHSEGFFESLPPMAGGIQAVKEIEQEGFRVLICTSPILTSQYCAQEKLNWIRQHMGEIWLEKVVLCADKASIRGDLLIDDKPLDYLTPCGRHTCATWKQVVFDAPYNRQMLVPRLYEWCDWRNTILPLLGKSVTPEATTRERGDSVSDIIEKMSPQYRREICRKRARELAQHLRDMYLGAIYSEVITPEDVASHTGSGSLFTEDPDLQAVDAGHTSDIKKNEHMNSIQRILICSNVWNRKSWFQGGPSASASALPSHSSRSERIVGETGSFPEVAPESPIVTEETHPHEQPEEFKQEKEEKEGDVHAVRELSTPHGEDDVWQKHCDVHGLKDSRSWDLRKSYRWWRADAPKTNPKSGRAESPKDTIRSRRKAYYNPSRSDGLGSPFLETTIEENSELIVKQPEHGYNQSHIF